MYKRMGSIAAILGTGLFSATLAGATSIANPYSGTSGTTVLSQWEGALTGTAMELNFSSLTGLETAPETLGGFSFSGFTKVLNQEFQGSSITITAPTGGETAMLLFINDQSGRDTAGSFTLTLSDGEATSAPVSLASPEFYGFTALAPITSVIVTANSSTLSIGDFWYGTAQGQNDPPTDPTSEAATFILTCGGLLVLFGTGRKLAQRQTT